MHIHIVKRQQVGKFPILRKQTSLRVLLLIYHCINHIKFQNIGAMIGGVALGYVAAGISWSMGAHVLLLSLLAVGLIATLFIKIR